MYEQALPISREVGDRAGEGTTLSNLAGVYRAIGQPKEALRLYEQALPIIREVGDRAGEGATLNNLALVYRAIGQPKEALRLYEQALPIRREVGDRAGEGATLNNLALVYSSIGQPKEALRLYEQALPIRREVGDRAGEGATLYNLALLYEQLERYTEAVDLYQQSLLLHQEVFHVAGEIAVLVSLAHLLYEHLNRPADAISSLERAIMLFQKTDLPQDAAGNTLKGVQQIVERLRNGSPFFSQTKDTDRTILIQTLSDFINAGSWDASRQILETQQDLLFQAESETLLEQFIQQAKEENNERAVQMLELHLAILRASKSEGIASVFARLQAQSTNTQDLPFDADLIQQSVAALLGNAQERMQYGQYLAELGAAADEQLKSLLHAIQLALFGGDLSHLGQDLQGVYRRGWEAIVFGVETGGLDPDFLRVLIERTLDALQGKSDLAEWREMLVQVQGKARGEGNVSFVAFLEALLHLIDADAEPVGLVTGLTGVYRVALAEITRRVGDIRGDGGR